jgi:hypothetical protein
MGCLKLKMLASNACLKCATYKFCFFSFYLFVLIVDKKYQNASVFILFFLDYTVFITLVTFLARFSTVLCCHNDLDFACCFMICYLRKICRSLYGAIFVTFVQLLPVVSFWLNKIVYLLYIIIIILLIMIKL